MLNADCSEYWFTDLSDSFLRRAKQNWQQQYPFVRYALLNAELGPVEQGFLAHSMDAVIIAYTHAAVLVARL